MRPQSCCGSYVPRSRWLIGRSRGCVLNLVGWSHVPSGRYERNVGVGGDDAASARAWCDEHGEAPAAHAGRVPVGTAGARMASCRGFCCRQGVTGGLRPAAGPAAATVVDDRRESRDRCTASVSCGLAGDGRTRRRPAADGTDRAAAGWLVGRAPATDGTRQRAGRRLLPPPGRWPRRRPCRRTTHAVAPRHPVRLAFLAVGAGRSGVTR